MSPSFFIKQRAWTVLLSLSVRDLFLPSFIVFLQCFVWSYQHHFATAAAVNNLFLRIPTAASIVLKQQLCTVILVSDQFLEELFLSLTFFFESSWETFLQATLGHSSLKLCVRWRAWRGGMVLQGTGGEWMQNTQDVRGGKDMEKDERRVWECNLNTGKI